MMKSNCSSIVKYLGLGARFFLDQGILPMTRGNSTILTFHLLTLVQIYSERFENGKYWYEGI